METIESEVRQFIVRTFLFGQAGDLANDTSFLEHGVVDSTGVLELVAYLQQQFGIRVEDAELLPANLDSIDAIAAFVERKQAGRV